MLFVVDLRLVDHFLVMLNEMVGLFDVVVRAVVVVSIEIMSVVLVSMLCEMVHRLLMVNSMESLVVADVLRIMVVSCEVIEVVVVIVVDHLRGMCPLVNLLLGSCKASHESQGRDKVHRKERLNFL